MRNRLCILGLIAILGLTGCSSSSSDMSSNGMAFGVASSSDSASMNESYSEGFDCFDSVDNINESYVESSAKAEIMDEIENKETNEIGITTEEAKTQPNFEDKLVYTYDVDFTVYDSNKQKAIDKIEENIDAFNGFIETSYCSETSYDVTIRIPTDKRDDFINSIKDDVELDSFTLRKNVDNLSSSYYDYLKSYEIAKDNYEAYKRLLEQASTVSEVLEVTEYVNTAKNTMDYMQRQMNDIDIDVAYSTINISVYLRTTIKGDADSLSFFGQLWYAFKSSFGDFIEFLDGLIFLIVENFFLLGFFIFIIYLIVRFIKKKIKKNKQEKKSDNNSDSSK